MTGKEYHRINALVEQLETYKKITARRSELAKQEGNTEEMQYNLGRSQVFHEVRDLVRDMLKELNS